MINTLSGAALNRAIAEKLGWRVEQRTLSHSGAMLWYVLVRPDGTTYECEDDTLPRQLDATNAKYLWEYTPDWANDVGAALELAIEHTPDDGLLSIGRFFSGDYSVHYSAGAYHDIVLSARGDTLALALARLALLALEGDHD